MGQRSESERLELAWFGNGVDHRARGASILAADTDERRAARVSFLEALDDSVSSLGARMATLASVASEALERPRVVHRDTILEMPAAAFEPDTQTDLPAATEATSTPEPEPEPERDAAPSPATSADRDAERDPEGVRSVPHEPDLLPSAAAGWQAEVELLYNDVLRLFSLGDTDGALVSLERLLIVAPINDQIRSFLRVNEAKLMKLYEGVMGPWSNVPRRVDGRNVADFFSQHAKFKTILHLVDGARDLGAILDESYFLPLETCAVLNQMIRAKVILAHDVPA